MANGKFEINSELLDKITGGSVYDDPSVSAEVVLAEAKQTAEWWVSQGWSVNQALEMLPRYFCCPGKVEKEDIIPIVKSAYGQE